MAFLTKSASSSDASTADYLQKVKDEVASGARVFKLDLNANPSSVLKEQAKGRWMRTITGLGGCGMMKLNAKNQRLFWEIDNTIGSYDDQDKFIPDTDFALNLSVLQLEESEDDKAIKALFLSQNKPCPPLSGAVLKETKLNGRFQRAFFQTTYGANYAKLTFNDDGSLDNLVDTMKTEKGLLTVYFSMNKTHVRDTVELDKRHEGEGGGGYKVFLEPAIIAVVFEEGKTVYNPKPRNVVSNARLERGFAAGLAAMAEDELNADGNKTLPDAFFEAIEIKQEMSLAKIGTGKKAHLDAKKGLIAAVEAGNWDHGYEASLSYIAKRGLNAHYTMSNHELLMGSLRVQLIQKVGDAAQALLASPSVAITPSSDELVNEALGDSVVSSDEMVDEALAFEEELIVQPVAVANPMDWLNASNKQAEADDEFADVDL
jgi:hypothetical protein